MIFFNKRQIAAASKGKDSTSSRSTLMVFTMVFDGPKYLTQNPLLTIFGRIVAVVGQIFRTNVLLNKNVKQQTMNMYMAKLWTTRLT